MAKGGCPDTGMIVQVYEIQTPGEAQHMIDLGVDHVGSVLLGEQGWRLPELRSTIERIQGAGRKSSLIPLFPSVETISAAIDYYRPDIVHFCETLPIKTDADDALEKVLKRQRAIRERFPQIALMRSIPIGCPGQGEIIPSLALSAAFEPLSDWFLTDTLLGAGNGFSNDQQPVNGYVGITGRTCDWAIAAELVRQSAIPVILAGGIGPDNVESAIFQVRPAGVDSCTLTNKTDNDGNARRFQKDPTKVNTLVQRARRAFNQILI